MTTPLIKANNLSVSYHSRGKKLQALRSVSLTLYPGETVAIIGESGCGKSTLGKCLLRLVNPSSGTIDFQGADLLALSKKQMQTQRRKLQILLQHPGASLDPRQTLQEILLEPFEIHSIGTRAERLQKVEELVNLVGLHVNDLNKYPYQFSGGQCQRIALARALSLGPDLLILDEPLSALDASIQRQITELLVNLQSRFQLTYLLITHDLSAARILSKRLIVMYLGEIVEEGLTEEVYRAPKHPYTQALLAAQLPPDPTAPKKHALHVIKGDPPSPFDLPSGCAFHTRCPRALPSCKAHTPVSSELAPGHLVKCHLF